MNWQNDPVVMVALDELLTAQQSPLNHFMETMNDYMDETPIYGILVLYGKFVMYYNYSRDYGDSSPNEAFQEAIGKLGNDPLTQALVANIMGSVLNKKVGL